ncbi:hypothetical protein AFLA_003219 [Aspergillus flavus NRRL3357]|nr:hypothetical protein AFLA_003219 [Aspergillus flavus NRRL3357]
MCSQTNRVTSKTAFQPDLKRRSTEWLFPGPAHELLYGSPQTRPSEFVKTRDYNWAQKYQRDAWVIVRKGTNSAGDGGTHYQPTKPTGAQEYAGEGDPVDQRRSRLKRRPCDVINGLSALVWTTVRSDRLGIGGGLGRSVHRVRISLVVLRLQHPGLDLGPH